MTSELNYYKHSINFFYSLSINRFLHKKEELLDESNQELITCFTNALKVLSCFKKYEIPSVYKIKLFTSCLIHLIGKYVQTNDEDLLKKAAEIIFNGDILRALPLNHIEAYMTIVFKKIYDLVSKNEAKKHKEFFNECIEIFLSNHNKKDINNNQKETEYLNDEMYLDTCNQLNLQNKTTNFDRSLFFDLCKISNPDDHNEYENLINLIPFYQPGATKRRTTDSSEFSQNQTNSPRESKIARLDEDKVVSSKSNETSLRENENSESSSKENTTPTKSKQKSFNEILTQFVITSNPSPKSKLYLRDNDKNSNSVVDSPRKLRSSLRSSDKNKEDLSITTIGECTTDPHTFDDIFNKNEKEIEISKEKDQAKTSKEANKKQKESSNRNLKSKNSDLLEINLQSQLASSQSNHEKNLNDDSDVINESDFNENPDEPSLKNSFEKNKESLKTTDSNLKSQTKETTPSTSKKFRIRISDSSTDDESENDLKKNWIRKDNPKIKKLTAKEDEDKDFENLESIDQDNESEDTDNSSYKKQMKPPRKKVKWTETETFYLVYGHIIYEDTSNIWSNILDAFRNKFHKIRTSVSLKDKWRNLQNSQELDELRVKAQAKIDSK